jgi:hypothetical protein
VLEIRQVLICVMPNGRLVELDDLMRAMLTIEDDDLTRLVTSSKQLTV